VDVHDAPARLTVMDLIGSRSDRWDRALGDAGYSSDEVVVVYAAHQVQDSKEFAVAYLGPGTDVSSSPVPLTNDEAQRLQAAGDQHRMAVPSGLDPEIELGIIRWALERARQFDANPAFLWFAEAVNNAVHDRYGEVGPGSAVVWHTIPSVRDADSAAGHLVTASFGEQLGQLWGAYGSLFRVDQPQADLTTLAKRLVVFAAIHAEDLEGWLDAEQSVSLGAVLAEVHPDAGAWWEALRGDEDFTHLRKSSPHYIPTEADIEGAGANPATAWRPLQRHLDITARRGARVVDI
jgi:hypothetical protein